MQAIGRACTPVICFRRLRMKHLLLQAALYILQLPTAQGRVASLRTAETTILLDGCMLPEFAL